MHITFDEFLESSLSRIYKHYKEHDTGTISAFRYAKDCGQGEKYKLEDNKRRSLDLKRKLLALGYGVTPIRGMYIENYGSDKAIEVSEDSYLVVDLKDTGKLKEHLLNLGRHFEQDSITYSKASGEYYIIGSSTCPNSYPGEGVFGYEKKLQSPLFGQDGKFHSRIRGRPFVFKEVENKIEQKTDHPPTEIRSIEASLKEDVMSGDIAVAYPTYSEVEKQSPLYKERKKEHHHRSW